MCIILPNLKVIGLHTAKMLLMQKEQWKNLKEYAFSLCGTAYLPPIAAGPSLPSARSTSSLTYQVNEEQSQSQIKEWMHLCLMNSFYIMFLLLYEELVPMMSRASADYPSLTLQQ